MHALTPALTTYTDAHTNCTTCSLSAEQHYETVLHLLLWLYTNSLPDAVPVPPVCPACPLREARRHGEGEREGEGGGEEGGWSVVQVHMRKRECRGAEEGGLTLGPVRLGPMTSLVALELTLLAPTLGLHRCVPCAYTPLRRVLWRVVSRVGMPSP